MSKLDKIAKQHSLSEDDREHMLSVVDLLLKDHRAIRDLMKKIQSSKSRPAQIKSAFSKLKLLVKSHVAAEEHGLLRVVMENPRFEEKAHEGYEEHRVHEYILSGIQGVSEQSRKIVQMKAFCEILEQHLDEEEEELFPRVKKLLALSTRKKLAKRFIKRRTETRSKKENVGVSKVILKDKKRKKNLRIKNGAARVQ